MKASGFARFLGILLSLSMLVTTLFTPESAYASGIFSTSEQTNSLLNNSEYIASTDSVLSAEGEQSLSLCNEDAVDDAEIIDSLLTGIYTRDFILDDGTFIAAMYGTAVGYEEDGKLLKVDNSLEYKDGTYRNKAGAVTFSMPESLGERGSISYKGSTLYFSYLGEESATAKIEEKEKKTDTRLNKMLSEITDSIITYDTETTSFRYGLCGNDLKEDVVMRAMPENMSFSYLLSGDGLKLHLNDDGSISAYKAETKTQEPETLPEESTEVETQNEEATEATSASDSDETDIATGESESNEAILEPVTDISETDSTENISEAALPAEATSPVYEEVTEPTPNEEESPEITPSDIIFEIPAAFARDSDNGYTDDIKTTLIETQEGYILTYEMPRDWMETAAFPVTLDPTIITMPIRHDIRDVTIATGDVLSNNDTWIEAGYQRDRGKERIFIKFNDIPTLNSADVITDAYLYLARTTDVTDLLQIDCQRPLGSWQSETLTWSNKPGCDANRIDYSKVSRTGWYMWDITEAAKQWYMMPAGNTGVMLKAPDDIENLGSHNNRTFLSSDYCESDLRPFLAIHYMNASGLEGYYDYDSFDGGRCGMASVNLPTGNLVISRTDMGFAGNRMPVSINFTYNNSQYKNEDGTVTNGGRFALGQGWRTNFNQRVYRYNAPEGTETDVGYYCWEDEDGTTHFFRYSSDIGKYKDESGLEYTLTASGSGNSKYVITDKDGNKSEFDTSGRLRKISNNQATKSHIDITYVTSGNRNRIDKVTDGAGREYRFSYANSGKISSIVFYGTTNTAQYTVTYAQDDAGHLRQVIYPDGGKALYGYGSNRLTSFTDNAGKIRLDFSYYSGTNHQGKVSRVRLTDTLNNVTDSNYTDYTYGKSYTTATDAAGNRLEYQFNRYCNTVSVQDKEGRALYTKYKDDAKNRAELTSKLQSASANLYRNASFERDGYVSIWPDATTTVTGTYTSAEHYMGSRSYKVTQSTNGGYTTVTPEGVSYETDTDYTLSVYLKIPGTFNAGGVCIRTNTGGQMTYGEKIYHTDDWKRFEMTFHTSATASTTNMTLCVRGAGTVYIDCIQIEKGCGATRYNLVENGDFRYAGADSYTPYNWVRSGCTATDKRIEVTAGTGSPVLDNNTFAIKGDAYTDKFVYQTIPVSGSAGDTFSVGGWARGDSVPKKTGGDNGYVNYDNGMLYGLTFRFNNVSGASESMTFYFIDFNTDLYDQTVWQYVCGRVVAKYDYTSVLVICRYKNNLNTVYFDGIQLYKDEFGSSYTYDNDGNVLSVKDQQAKTTTYEYQNNDLTKSILPGGATLEYDYDNYHNVTGAKSATGITAEFEYDNYGNNTLAGTYVDGTPSRLFSRATYTSNGNLLASLRDTRGLTTTYSYNTGTGMLESVTAPGGMTTSYEYDDILRNESVSVSPVSGTTIETEYTYSNDRLTTITHGAGSDTTSYSFNYGNFGQVSGISVGSHTLISNTYDNTPLHNLSSSTYGNGDSISYTYTGTGQLTGKTYEDNSHVSYGYDNEGKLTKVMYGDVTETVSYDISGRPVSERSDFGAGSSRKYSYDSKNNVSSVKSSAGTVSYIDEYIYDADNRETKSVQGKILGKTEYSNLGTVRYISNYYDTDNDKECDNNEIRVRSGYLYQELMNDVTSSSLLRQYTVSIADNQGIYNYITYNPQGFIETVSDCISDEDPLILKNSYEYDGLGQLIRENNVERNLTAVYTYDNAGNITQKKEYAYSAGEINTAPVHTYNYSYTDSSWGDLLTGFGGRTYTNDAIGNRLSDGIWDYTWEHGRVLSGMARGDEQIYFEYNSDGLRTGKYTEDCTYTYYYSNGQLTDILESGTPYMHFTYDSMGRPATLKFYGGLPYYYICNAQGDVTGLLDSDGNICATYEYDAWGRIIGTGGCDEVGDYNPLLYRGYFYDWETGLYYLQSRYYDPQVGRFINADGQLTTGSDLTGLNLFAYCGNNPVNRVDLTGEAWWHWALGAVVVAACAVATVVTCGGFAAAATAVCMVGSGVATATTASTVAAGAFIGSAFAYSVTALSTASNSKSLQEFNDQGNWGTVATTAFGGLTGGCNAYTLSKAQMLKSTPTGKGSQNPKVNAAIQKGQAMHKQMDYGPGVLKEKTIAPGCRVDGIDFNNHIIYELKPNNPQAIARGLSQLNRYTSSASQQFGGEWTGVLRLYD